MITLYNTLTSKKEKFKPIKLNHVGIYVCGVTVYDYCHIGHGRSSVIFDIIRRVFIYNGYKVTFVKNFTDIDDKIIKRANDNNEDWKELAERFIKAHNKDMDNLFILRPDSTPKATEYINKMINFCERLIELEHAYESEGDIYFRVNSFDDYGKLSRRNIEELMAGARVDISEKKENPLDFALWKAAKEGEPSWSSPWGEGRPGWHIECSVMSESILGSHIDIHGGGQDLIFPHHENEIAQSESISCSTFANYWIHNGFVNINKEKMSKSFNNFFTIRDILKIHNNEALRYFFLTTHYRQPLEYSEDKLIEAKTALNRIYIYLDELNYIEGSLKGKDLSDDIEKLYNNFKVEFNSAINDDFNTPKAIASIFEVVRLGNSMIASKPSISSIERLKEYTSKIFQITKDVLGIINSEPSHWFKSNLPMSEDELLAIIAKRSEARKNKDFQQADKIRDDLMLKGIEIMDTTSGSRYRVI